MTDPEPEKVSTALRELLEGTPVFLVYAHGSRTRDDARADSDLDLGYYACRDGRLTCLGLEAELRIAGALTESLGCEADFRCLSDAPLQARGRVLEEGLRVYCGDDAARVDLERDLLGRYHDYKPKFEEWRRLRLEAATRRGS